MTEALRTWGESWVVFLAMCAWLIFWAGAQITAGAAPGKDRQIEDARVYHGALAQRQD